MQGKADALQRVNAALDSLRQRQLAGEERVKARGVGGRGEGGGGAGARAPGCFRRLRHKSCATFSVTLLVPAPLRCLEQQPRAPFMLPHPLLPAVFFLYMLCLKSSTTVIAGSASTHTIACPENLLLTTSQPPLAWLQALSQELRDLQARKAEENETKRQVRWAAPCALRMLCMLYVMLGACSRID